MSLIERLKSTGAKRIPALDGGGIRGALTVRRRKAAKTKSFSFRFDTVTWKLRTAVDTVSGGRRTSRASRSL